MHDYLIREEMMFGPEAVQRLQAKHVAVFGIGGVGSYAVEALARAGIGALTLVDNDTVGISNLYRRPEQIRRHGRARAGHQPGVCRALPAAALQRRKQGGFF